MPPRADGCDPLLVRAVVPEIGLGVAAVRHPVAFVGPLRNGVGGLIVNMPFSGDGPGAVRAIGQALAPLVRA